MRPRPLCLSPGALRREDAVENHAPAARGSDGRALNRRRRSRLSFGAPTRGALALLLTATLLGCATATPYQPKIDRFGFTEREIETNRYAVTFEGNAQTPRDVVETYLLFRAAETTLAAGGDYFRIADRDTEAKTRYRAVAPVGFGLTPFPRRRKRGVLGYGGFGYAPFGYAPVTARPITRYAARADIVVYIGEKPAEDPSAYDALDVIQRLGPRIQRPETAEGGGAPG